MVYLIEDLCQYLNHAPRGLPVPQGWRPASFAITAKNLVDLALNFIYSDEFVGAFGYRDGTLGVGSHRQTRDAQNGGFLLDAAGIGDHEFRGAP